MTARTPGSARARPTSRLTMRACAWVLRKTLPTSMPGSAKSAAYTAVPVTLPGASNRGSDLPTTCSSLVAIPSPPRRNGAAGRHHRVGDLLVPGAAAEVAFQRLSHVGLGGAGTLL